MGMGVVPRGEIEAAIRAELDGAGVVAALFALFREPEDDLFTREVEDVTRDGEAAELLAVKVLGRVQAVDPAVFGELGVQRESQKAVLLAIEDLEGAG